MSLINREGTNLKPPTLILRHMVQIGGYLYAEEGRFGLAQSWFPTSQDVQVISRAVFGVDSLPTDLDNSCVTVTLPEETGNKTYLIGEMTPRQIIDTINRELRALLRALNKELEISDDQVFFTFNPEHGIYGFTITFPEGAFQSISGLVHNKKYSASNQLLRVCNGAQSIATRDAARVMGRFHLAIADFIEKTPSFLSFTATPVPMIGTFLACSGGCTSFVYSAAALLEKDPELEYLVNYGGFKEYAMACSVIKDSTMSQEVHEFITRANRFFIGGGVTEEHLATFDSQPMVKALIESMVSEKAMYNLVRLLQESFGLNSDPLKMLALKTTYNFSVDGDINHELQRARQTVENFLEWTAENILQGVWYAGKPLQIDNCSYQFMQIVFQKFLRSSILSSCSIMTNEETSYLLRGLFGSDGHNAQQQPRYPHNASENICAAVDRLVGFGLIEKRYRDQFIFQLSQQYGGCESMNATFNDLTVDVVAAQLQGMLEMLLMTLELEQQQVHSTLFRPTLVRPSDDKEPKENVSQAAAEGELTLDEQFLLDHGYRHS